MLGEAEERAVLEVLRSGQLSLGPRVAEFERRFAARVGAPLASAVSSGTAGLHLALRAVGVGEGDEVITSPFSFVASANAALYERARPVFADIDPVTLNLDPQAAAAAVSERTRALLPVHIFGYPADMPAFERLAERHGLAIVEDACEALGAVHADGTPVGGRGHPAVFGFYANKQLTTGEGGMVTLADASAEGSGSTPSATRVARRTWAGSTTTGWASTTASRTSPARSASPSWSASSRCSPDAPAVAGAVPRGARRRRGARAALPRQRRQCARLVRVRRAASRGTSIATERSARWRRAGIQSKPYLPAIHLMSFYRERFGHREGEFPVCEDVAARSLALPFFPQMSEGQVERVAAELRAAIAPGAPT